MRFRSVLVTAAITLMSLATWAQNAAPRETVTAMVGGQKVSVEYGRPSLKGRSFDDLAQQLPEDRMWRTGSEQITTMTVESDILMGGKKVPAGKYTLYVHCPVSGDYSLAVNSVLGQPLSKIFAAAPPALANQPWPHFAYTQEIGDNEVARVPMKKVSGPETDLFTIAFQESGEGATMTLSWGDRSWSLEITSAN